MTDVCAICGTIRGDDATGWFAVMIGGSTRLVCPDHHDDPVDVLNMLKTV